MLHLAWLDFLTDFRWTPTELAFAVPSGVIIGALLALWGVSATNQANFRRAHAEKLFDKRAELYVELIGLIREVQDVCRATYSESVPGMEPSLEKLNEPLGRMEAMSSSIDAYATRTIVKLLGAWEREVTKVCWNYQLFYPKDDKTDKARTEISRHIRRGYRPMRNAELNGESIIDVMRRELQGRHDGRWS